MHDVHAEAIRAHLEAADRILVIAHVGPDGDAMGSLTAMGVALEQLGKRTTLVCDDGLPARFAFLPHSERVQKYPAARVRYHLVFALDCGDMSRMGQAYQVLPEPKPQVINVDHHVTNTRFGDVNIVNSECVSTTEILHALLSELGVSLTKDLATSLLTGIVTDTLGFRTVGVTPRTFQVASELMEAGADLTTITTESLLIKPLSMLLLWQTGLKKMKFEEEGLLWTSISDEERRSIGHMGSSSGGLANMLANVDEATMSAVLLEDNGRVYVGLRCRPPYSVSELALNLGGGGHPLAAGCTLEASLSDAESLVVGMCKESIRQQRSLMVADF